MDINEWKLKNDYIRRYSHFDRRVSLSTVWDYITDKDKVTHHSFYPFVHYQKHFNKFNKRDGLKSKDREICYSAHIDRCIYQYYGYQLNQKYNKRANIDNINNVAIAYRDNLKKNNINFAKEAFDYIRKVENCYIIVGDFTKFFDNLSHKYLKTKLIDLIEEKLPDDYYAVFKNITQYSTWDLNSLLELNNLKDTLEDRQTLNTKERIISTTDFKQYKKVCVKGNLNDFGIPQGSAISAILSNIYMLSFDKIINDYVQTNSGLYMRYSDDFIVILPNINEENFRKQLDFIRKNIKKVPNLELQPDKTQIYRYQKSKLDSCTNKFISEVKDGSNTLDYLGFTFDGKTVAIRDKTISKYYYRMYRKLRTITSNNGYTPNGKKISCKNLYLKYSYKGANTDKGNFITYVQRAETIFGKHEAINRSTKNHMQKIRKKLKQIN